MQGTMGEETGGKKAVVRDVGVILERGTNVPQTEKRCVGSVKHGGEVNPEKGGGTRGEGGQRGNWQG